MNKIAKELLKVSKLLTSGHDHITIRGYGMSEGEAISDAQEQVHDEYGYSYEFREVLKVKKVRTPKRSKKVKVEKFQAKGGRAKKHFVVYGGRSDNEKVGSYEKKSDALKKAKEWSLNNNKFSSVVLEAYCEKGGTVFRIRPGESTQGAWNVTMDYHT